MYRMMHRFVGVFAIAVACTALFAGGASASPAPTGSRLFIWNSQQTFPAGQPFYFEHGWQNGPSIDGGLGLWTFSLSVDGVPQHGFVIPEVTTQDPTYGTLIYRPFLFNFPQGMTGTHVFAGTFSGPCKQMVEQGWTTGPCSSPNQVVPSSGSPYISTVTFVP